jgi:hypothetical protein
MSMKNYAGSGWLIKASDIEPLLPVLHRVKYRELLENGDWEGIQDFLSENWPDNLPKFNDVYLHADEDESEDLEHGEIYVSFDESDLFVKTPTPAFAAMKSANVEPKFQRWVQWG